MKRQLLEKIKSHTQTLMTILGLLVATLGFSQEVEWMTFEEAVEANKVQPKPFLIDIYTDWCGWCKRMEKDTYSNKDLAEYINQNFYPVKMDGEEQKTFDFNGKQFKFIKQGRRGYNELPAALMNGKLSYPTTVFLDSKYQLIQRLPGYITLDKMEPIVVYLSEGKYKDTPWEDFSKSYDLKFSK
ncbi:MAG: hypothetical protein SchgKO_22940 [Schleiferiaceae bacterium]